jgi:hypothetical protein
MPIFQKKYELFLWIAYIKERYIKLFTNVKCQIDKQATKHRTCSLRWIRSSLPRIHCRRRRRSHPRWVMWGRTCSTGPMGGASFVARERWGGEWNPDTRGSKPWPIVWLEGGEKIACWRPWKQPSVQ